MDTSNNRGLTVLAALSTHPWAMLPHAWSELEALCFEDLPTLEQAAPTSRERTPSRSRGVMVLPITGTIFPKPNLFTQYGIGTALTDLRQQFREALQSDAETIVFDVDSPGGSVALVDELSAEIFAARNQKKTISVVNPLMASAAFNLGTAAQEVVVSPSGAIGSVGVFAQHVDVSAYEEQAGIKTTLISAGRYKTEGHPYAPLTNEARSAIQQDVDSYYEDFLGSVARNRDVSRNKVRKGFGEGRVVRADEAIAEGMADRTGTLSTVLEGLGAAVPTRAISADIDQLKLKILTRQRSAERKEDRKE